MKKGLLVIMALCLVASIALVGCGPQKAGSSREAINTAKTMQTPQEQAQYLVGQAKAFINSDEFQNAIDVLQYVLASVDRDNPQAKALLEQAKDALAAQAKGAAKDVKESFGF
jgi:hypothetical protein